ncbi:tRNA pseudouridine synthase D [gamma proteobacterium HdN1]|nr:tRNA pseudouridine synthase D [gamma proteobacterium HdN1]
MTDSHWASLAFAFGGSVAFGALKSSEDDFRVDEVLGFEPDGSGEHLCVQVWARGQNTAWLVRQLAQWANVPRSSVSFSGQKDRHAITTQWFSIHLPGRSDPEVALFQQEGWRILQAHRHSRKLRIGTHWGNQFEIVLRNLVWVGDACVDDLNARLQKIQSVGVPNYFGAQRFGKDEGNLARALQVVASGKLPRDRDERSWTLSALRSYLFNLWLSERVQLASWNQWVEGDLLQRAGRRGFFVADQLDHELNQRLQARELVPAGVLPGEEPLPFVGKALTFAEQAWAGQADALAFLRKQRLKQEVRSAVLFAENFEYHLEDTDLRLKFFLPRGSFATSVIREIIFDASISPHL